MTRSFESEIGTLTLAADDDGALTELWLPNRFDPRGGASETPSRAAAAVLDETERQLTEYFEGKRRTFELTLRPSGSEFEQRVWSALLDIPYGTTTSYGAISDALHIKNGARAVGMANGANPIAIIIPCHRVIGASGSLVGYGGGLPLKRRLLDLESATALGQLPLFHHSPLPK